MPMTIEQKRARLRAARRHKNRRMDTTRKERMLMDWAEIRDALDSGELTSEEIRVKTLGAMESLYFEITTLQDSQRREQLKLTCRAEAVGC